MHAETKLIIFIALCPVQLPYHTSHFYQYCSVEVQVKLGKDTPINCLDPDDASGELKLEGWLCFVLSF